MRKLIALITAGLVFGASGIAMASDTSVVGVTYHVGAVTELSVTAPTQININTLGITAGTDLIPASQTAAYAITTNHRTKIMASVDAALPNFVTLGVSFTNPGNGAAVLTPPPFSSFTVAGDTSDLVSGIPYAANTGTVTYTLTAPVKAGVINVNTTTVTFTLTDDPII